MTTSRRDLWHPGTSRTALPYLLTFVALALSAGAAAAHNVTEGDAGYIQEIWVVNIIPFMYLGAKHMVTGYDHILFLLGVVFFLYKMRDVGIYVSLFAVGHSATMLLGVWFGWGINAYIIDAIIGFSVVYKALENLGGFQRLGVNPNTRLAVLIFGLFHGFGLATKLQEISLSQEGLLANLIAFNVGVEVGQLLALLAIITLMSAWRRQSSFPRQAIVANTALMFAGYLLVGYQLSGFFLIT